jgi:hypothetical protein
MNNEQQWDKEKAKRAQQLKEPNRQKIKRTPRVALGDMGSRVTSFWYKL